jgi:hypothetical protein
MRDIPSIPAPVLIAANVAIVVATLTVGGGAFFHESGLIHAIALLFIVLAAVRIFTRFYLFDPELRILLLASLAAMAVFALSHLVEFASFTIGHGYTDAAFANVINFYVISLLILLYGAETAIVRYRKAGEWKLAVIGACALGLLVLTVLFLTATLEVSLEPEDVAPYAYAALVAAALASCVVRWRKLRAMYGWFHGFIDRVLLSAGMVALATAPNVFYEHLEHVGVSERLSIYLSHFTFYAALTVMYLAFDRIQDLGGLHKDLREQIRKTAA